MDNNYDEVMNSVVIVEATKKTNHFKNFISDVVDLQHWR